MIKMIAMILGGGAGSRLFPLTEQRSKPAVPIGGKYRLIDIPISNCLNSGLKRMFVLTQFKSSSCQIVHRHIHAMWSRRYLDSCCVFVHEFHTGSAWLHMKPSTLLGLAVQFHV